MNVVPTIPALPTGNPAPGGESYRGKWVYRPYGNGTPGYWVRTIVR
jgi:hypothetical protein